MVVLMQLMPPVHTTQLEASNVVDLRLSPSNRSKSGGGGAGSLGAAPVAKVLADRGRGRW